MKYAVHIAGHNFHLNSHKLLHLPIIYYLFVSSGIRCFRDMHERTAYFIPTFKKKNKKVDLHHLIQIIQLAA